MHFFRESELKVRQLLKGVNLRSVSGDKTMLTIFDFEPNAVVPSHQHLHEQITYVIKGELEFTMDGETKVLREGDGIVVHSNKEHSARVLSKQTKVIDAWYPIREDYRQKSVPC